MKIIYIEWIEAPQQCRCCGQFLIKPFLRTSGSDSFDNGDFCSQHCINQYFGTDKIVQGEIGFKDKPK